MSVSLWEALDEATANHLMAEMGPTGDYPDHQITAVEVGDTWNPDAGPRPAILIVSNDADLSSAGHGQGGPHVGATYEYMVVAYTEAESYASAKRAAQTLHGRLIAAVRQWPPILAAAQAATTTGEHADRVRFDRSRIEVRGRQGATRGRYYGIAVLRYEVDTMN